MAANGSFAISISATDNASKALDGINKRLAALSAPAERFNKALTRFGDTSGISRVAEGVGELGRTAATTFASLDRLASPLAAITGAASIAGMVELTRRWAEFGSQVGNVAYRLNLPVEKLTSLHGAARLSGVAAADLDSGLRGLGDTLSGAAFGRNPHAVQLLRQLGVGFGDATHGARRAEDALGDVADAIQKLNPLAQARVLNELGLGEAMLPMLKNGRKGLEEFRKKADATGANMTSQMVANATEMNQAWQRLGLDIEGVGNRIVDSWSGTVTKVLKGTSDWIEYNKALSDSIGEIGTAIGVLAALKPAAWVLRLLGLGALVPSATTSVIVGTVGAAGGAAGSMNAPMVDDFGRVIGNWGGRDESNNPATGSYAMPLGLRAWWGNNMPSWAGGSAKAAKNPADPAQLRNYFKSQGWDDDHIAAVLGNYQGESGLDAGAIGDRGASAGLGMWRGPRRGAFRLMFGHDPSEGTPLEQAKFTQWELTHTEKDAGDHFFATTGARAAAGVLSKEYERPLDVGMNATLRGQYAEAWRQKLSDMPDGGGTQGHVQVDVHLKNAPAGTTAHVTTRGPVNASPPRVETSLPMVN